MTVFYTSQLFWLSLIIYLTAAVSGLILWKHSRLGNLLANIICMLAARRGRRRFCTACSKS